MPFTSELLVPSLREDDFVVGSLVIDDRDSLRDFLEAEHRISWTRKHLWKYNLLLGGILVVISLCKIVESYWRRRKCSRAVLEDVGEEEPASDTSSTLTGTATPPDVKPDDETTPLVAAKSVARSRTFWRRISNKLQAFLIFQPRPIPIVDKTLPSNGTTLFVLAFMATNLILCFVNIPWAKPSIALMVSSDRFGNFFSANLPLLYLLAAKNQPLKYLTGFSYEALNIFHRRLGELLCFFALVHGITQIIVFYPLYRPLLKTTLFGFFAETRVLVGVLAFVSYEVLYFTSLGSFRQRWYEIFLAAHILLQAGGLAFLYFHFHCSQWYVISSLAIFLVDRLVFRLMMKTTTTKANVEVLPDGQTVMLSANWSINPQRPLIVGARSIKNGWHPCAHVFITIPALGNSAALQAHPFTIASAAPDLSAAQRHAWFNVLIRAHDGFTRDLLRHAQLHPDVDVRIDGPYGSLEPLHMLQSSDHAVLIAGGSGIAVVFPLIWALLHEKRSPGDSQSGSNPKYRHNSRRVTLIWVIHSASHTSWVPQERLDELVQLGLDLRMPPPTTVHGRPDLSAMLQDIVYASPHENVHDELGVVVSGPDALNRDVRNTCSRLIEEGMDVNITVEKFGW